MSVVRPTSSSGVNETLFAINAAAGHTGTRERTKERGCKITLSFQGESEIILGGKCCHLMDIVV